MNYPIVGYNYSSLDTTGNYTDGTYSSYRWSTFKIGYISSKSALRVNINGSTGITSYPQSGLALYVIILNSSGTAQTKWVDGNSNYSGVGNPGSSQSNGDAAMFYGQSSATLRYITFGTPTYTGDIWVRIGIGSGSGITFTSLSYTAV